MSSPRSPNVIFFFTDQQRHDTTGVHGCPLGLTPNFDRLARQGTHAVNSFTVQPVCGPSRACLQTSLYATQTGVWRNGIAPHAHLRTLAHHFNDAGYHTGYIGKWHLAPRGVRGPVPVEYRGGYQTWLAANVVEGTSNAYDAHLWDGDGREHKLPGYRVDAFTDAAIRFISEPRERPYFLFLSHLEPHHQNHIDAFPAPTGYEERYTGAWLPPDLAALRGSAPQHWPGYCGMVKRLDEALGRLTDALRSLGQLENTIIVFTSDHGCHFKTRGREYKRTCHEASIRVPLAIGGPGFDGGHRLDQLTTLLDLPPTLLEAAGLPVPKEMMGRSLLSLVRDHRAPWRDDVFVQLSEHLTGRAVRTARWKYGVRFPGVEADGLPVCLPAAEEYADECLYDLSADPWELSNLIGMAPFRDVVADLRERLLRNLQAAGETRPRFVDAPAQPSEQRQVEYHGSA